MSSAREIPLNLPDVELSLRLDDTTGSQLVFDRLRLKWVTLTPEERVRQHFINWLVVYKGFPQGRLANEVTINHNGHRRRCDTVIYDAGASPIGIIEYKSPDVIIDNAVFEQIFRYNIVLGTPWLIVSNGIAHYCCKIENKGCRFVSDIPYYQNL